MISASFSARLPGFVRMVAAPALIATLLASCGGEKLADPQKFYGDLVNAVRKKDGRYMYEVLDSARRAEIDTLIGLQMKNLENLPPEERTRWDSLKGKEKKEIYAQMIVNDQSVEQMFGGNYKITRVDTLVVLTVEHEGQQPNIMYLRPRDGGYKITSPPRVPESPYRGTQRPPEAPGTAPEAVPPTGGSDTGAQLK